MNKLLSIYARCHARLLELFDAEQPVALIRKMVRKKRASLTTLARGKHSGIGPIILGGKPVSLYGSNQDRTAELQFASSWLPPLIHDPAWAKSGSVGAADSEGHDSEEEVLVAASRRSNFFSTNAFLETDALDAFDAEDWKTLKCRIDDRSYTLLRAIADGEWLAERDRKYLKRQIDNCVSPLNRAFGYLWKSGIFDRSEPRSVHPRIGVSGSADDQDQVDKKARGRWGSMAYYNVQGHACESRSLLADPLLPPHNPKLGGWYEHAYRGPSLIEYGGLFDSSLPIMGYIRHARFAGENRIRILAYQEHSPKYRVGKRDRECFFFADGTPSEHDRTRRMRYFVCRLCGTAFKANTGSRFCSESCRVVASVRLMEAGFRHGGTDGLPAIPHELIDDVAARVISDDLRPVWLVSYRANPAVLEEVRKFYVAKAARAELFDKSAKPWTSPEQPWNDIRGILPPIPDLGVPKRAGFVEYDQPEEKPKALAGLWGRWWRIPLPPEVSPIRTRLGVPQPYRGFFTSVDAAHAWPLQHPVMLWSDDPCDRLVYSNIGLRHGRPKKHVQNFGLEPVARQGCDCHGWRNYRPWFLRRWRDPIPEQPPDGDESLEDRFRRLQKADIDALRNDRGHGQPWSLRYDRQIAVLKQSANELAAWYRATYASAVTCFQKDVSRILESSTAQVRGWALLAGWVSAPDLSVKATGRRECYKPTPPEIVNDGLVYRPESGKRVNPGLAMVLDDIDKIDQARDLSQAEYIELRDWAVAEFTRSTRKNMSKVPGSRREQVRGVQDSFLVTADGKKAFGFLLARSAASAHQ